MLIEIWENLRGYDKWTPTVATVQSSTLTPVQFGDVKEGKDGNEQAIAWQSVCKIVWEDRHCIQHTAEFELFEESPLYQLTDRDTVSIRFNPNKPAEFYLPGLLQSRLARTWKLGIWAVLAILVFIGVVVAWFGPGILNAFSH
jgi:hypothetical protein